jgi:hypothetical protein
MWMAGNGGLTHRRAADEWTAFDKDNSELPSTEINAIASDENNGVWIGTPEGLTHYTATGEWRTFDQSNSDLSHNEVLELASDGDGGVWLSTDGSLDTFFHLSATYEWTLFDMGVEDLLSNGKGDVWALVNRDGKYALSKKPFRISQNGAKKEIDAPSYSGTITNWNIGKDKLWATLLDDFAHFDSKAEKWQVFEGNDMVSGGINSVLPDGDGGVWLGTRLNGLVHRSQTGQWTVLDTDSSMLPHNEVNALYSDRGNGVWIITGDDSLSHLSFGEKSTLVQIIEDPIEQEAMLQNERAAIIVHPRGQSTGYNQEIAIDFMAKYAYYTLQARGYDNDEIYFLSHKADLDFNDDATTDNVIDAPVTPFDIQNGITPRDLTIADVQGAFDWANAKGKLDYPLIVIFVDHGIPGGLMLDPLGQEILTAELLKGMLDDYQTAIDNEVVVILEACHTGTLVETLAAPNRLIISSTGDGLAYYDDVGRVSFSKLYFDQLRQGETFLKAMEFVREALPRYRWPFDQQDPQFEGEIARTACLNRCFGNLPGVLTLTPQLFDGIVNIGEPIDLSVQASIDFGGVNSIWASVMTPEIAAQRNEQGYSLEPSPIIYLFEFNNGRKGKRDSRSGLQWQGQFSEFNTPGDYVIVFKAKSDKGFITEAIPVVLTVEGEKTLTHARFDPSANRVHIPAMTLPNLSSGETDIYQLDLVPRFEPGILFELELASVKPVSDTTSMSYASFNLNTTVLHIPILEIPNASGDMDNFSVDLKFVPPTSPESPLQFTVESLTPQQ